MEELAYLAYHLHWPLEDLVALERADRRGWVTQVSAINDRRNAEAG